MARRDADGYIHLVDRKSNMIISGGENIYPSEVEALSARIPWSRTWPWSACPDAKWGERVHAVIVLHDGATAEARPSCWTGARTAWPATSARAPTPSCATSEMPRNATGKILHRELKKKLPS